jgi:hypothetical protein
MVPRSGVMQLKLSSPGMLKLPAINPTTAEKN